MVRFQYRPPAQTPFLIFREGRLTTTLATAATASVVLQQRVRRLRRHRAPGDDQQVDTLEVIEDEDGRQAGVAEGECADWAVGVVPG
jgi:hypothetical protein